ncbi:hypothetical protein IAD21_06168 [Abditibacteriota bacterium]|nr:hypothetical protein IAD21_06168 [Abditibacteriota bacterium]
MIWRSLLALFAVQLFSLVLTLWGSGGIAFGLNPESLQTLDGLVPLVSLFCVSWWMGRGRAGYMSWGVALVNIGFWVLMHGFVAARFQVEFWRDGLTQLGFAHLFWWALAMLAARSGAALSARFPTKRTAVGLVPVALLAVSGAQMMTARDRDAHFESDGTSWRVLEYNLKSVDFGIYDADSDDVNPNDNRNATWLAQAMPRVWSKITALGSDEPLCVVNGGFFGASAPLVGEHEAPIRSGGRSIYDVNALESDWPTQNATLVWKREKGVTRPQILQDVAFTELQQFEGALGGVRVLMQDGKREVLEPGMGGTTLKCCRTSVAWNTRTGKFWVLSMRDPDGEASSVSDNQWEKKTGQRVQVGGWDVGQVQDFWVRKGATDAVLFDGGESGQIAYRDKGERWRWVHSSYHLSRTAGFWKARPLRAVLPMLPPHLANGGVLNWFYVRPLLLGKVVK